jgi:hypothetical protein
MSYAFDGVDKANFHIVIFEKYPILVMHHSVKGGFVSMIPPSDARQVRDKFAKLVQVGDERIGASGAESGLDVFGDPVRVIDKADGVYGPGASRGIKRAGEARRGGSTRPRARSHPE